MLQSLSIRDFIIVDALDLEFLTGFTTLTGETGAGKSILIDALSLALGARGDGVVTRAGCEKADISATFDNTEFARKWLESNEIAADDSLLLRRVLYADGRSRAFINGVSVTVGQLKELGDLLVDIYSQNMHHSLLKTATQRQILDEFAGLDAQVQQVASYYKAWVELDRQRKAYEQNATAYADELAELRDKNRELAQLNFSTEMWADLQAEHARLSHGAALIQGVEASVNLLGELEINARDLLSQAYSQLQHVAEYDAQLNEPLEAINNALIQAEDANRFLSRYLQRTELDPERLQEVDNQMQNIHDTARKYRLRVEEIADVLDMGQARMAELESFSDDGVLARRCLEAEHAYMQAAQILSDERAKAAVELSAQITQHMQTLSLAGGQFLVEITPQVPSAHGLEHVEFMVAGHAGVTARPLNKVASGGELSRISLALHVTTAKKGTTPTMIFDEVDVGIGGAVAEVVGRLLHALGKENQVLVITHLPQVAAQAQHHLQVRKSQSDGQTLSHIQPLSTVERIEEIARMLGGVQITDTALSHAREMLGM
ncbi:MAG TPA: DNA repair protein RecN [Methylophilus sp.]|nr:DNA repair protein RecN [Methylophilus sp.]HQQ32532.1 DNA repair protein RecN [Methylophilus sp.]